MKKIRDKKENNKLIIECPICKTKLVGWLFFCMCCPKCGYTTNPDVEPYNTEEEK